ncbi:hypothetical protein HDV63DRAFT_315910 [Trichoderma sp. SZMC 28014]
MIRLPSGIELEYDAGISAINMDMVGHPFCILFFFALFFSTSTQYDDQFYNYIRWKLPAEVSFDDILRL